MNTEKTLAIFDFDGTITTKDTLFEFIRFYHGSSKFTLGFLLLAPVLILYKLKIIPNWRAKEFVLTHFFKNERIDSFNEKCRNFAEQVLPKLIRPLAMKAIRQYKEDKATVVVVSASPENWVKPWCALYDLHCIATRLKDSDNLITGRILGKNCYGKEKVVQIKKQFDLQQYKNIHTFGDTPGDRPMLSLGNTSQYKPFRN